MDIKFNVHNVAQSEEQKNVEIGGETVPARVPCTEVELTTDDEAHGSLVLRFRGAKAKEAASIFKVGQSVSWSLSDQPEASPVEPSRDMAAAQA